MKRYKAYKARKLKFPKRLLFFALFALIVFALAVLSGNILKKQLESADIDKKPIEKEIKKEKGEDDDPTELGIPHDSAELYVNAGYLDLSHESTEESVRESISALQSAGYNAVSVNITDGDGMLKVRSEKLEMYTKMKASEKLVSPEILRYAASYATSLGMKPTALMLHGNADTDTLVISEIAEAGFSELTLLGFSGTSFEADTVQSFCDYVSNLRTKVGIRLGVCFDKELYLNAKNTATLEKVFAVSDFLAVDFRDCTTEEIASTAKDVKGSFTYYMIRPVISPADTDTLNTLTESLSSSGIGALQLATTPIDKNAPVKTADSKPEEP